MKAMRRLRWWQRIICRIWCPGWKAEAPETNDPGPWIAVALVQTHRGEFERERRMVDSGLRDAYEVARWIALWLADRTPTELGVRWAIRKANATSEGPPPSRPESNQERNGGSLH